MGGTYSLWVGYNKRVPKSQIANFPNDFPLTKIEKAPSGMAVATDTVRWQGDLWMYPHPFVLTRVAEEEPKGLCAAFADGRGEWVEFDQLNVAFRVPAVDFYWPNPRVRDPYPPEAVPY